MMYPLIPIPTKTQQPIHEVLKMLGRSTKEVPGTSSVDPGTAWRVRAGVTIPAGITVGPYPSEMLLGTNTTDRPRGERYVEVKIEDRTLIASHEVDMETPRHWLLHVTPARDRHEQNVEAIRDIRGMIAFRIIKEIQKGHELLVWYSADLAMECNIPILTPANIRGGQSYGCTACDVTFRYPNTLKAHIRFHCAHKTMTSWLGQYNSLQTGNLLTAYQQELSKYLSHLWTLRSLGSPEGLSKVPTPLDLSPRLRSPSKSAFSPCSTSFPGITKNSPPVLSPTTLSSMPGRTLSDKNRNNDNLSIDIKNQIKDRDSRHSASSTAMTYPAMTSLPNYLDSVYMCNYARYLGSNPSSISAQQARSLGQGMPFTPITPRDTLTTNHLPSSGMSCHDDMGHRENMSPGSDGDTSPKLPIGHINFPMPSDTAGEPIDLLPKSLYMSKSYKGHLCIYCGKLYSRKYGLKIHLRTHTGYKPLKCKVCLRAFGDPSNLNKHIRLHAEGETPYRCEYCGKVLVRRRDLERHIKSRHPNQITSLTPCQKDQSKVMCDTDTSFANVDHHIGDSDCDSDVPIDMSCHDIEVA